MRAKVDDPDLIERMFTLAKRSKQALTVQSGAKELHLSWATARSLLRSLVSQGRLEAIQTSNGWVFRQKPNEPQVAVAEVD